ncbi:MAG TPA: TetR/AcrR family transcriptional regulator [Candidatus Blautia pullicola]|uniref:TetR/AcrR family transcriptional regulator n=1 Tax=Candidatus Blautia pullicola TaxID=2838498 RepID=A0A9D2FTN4_9FIRM|nr:TetR/AcrR family transcriptional regulator [Candidatus Blautia pullicola]
MARNKYPEVTVEKILEVSERLFLEKGYDSTTIQDIVDELGGLTKGAIYHHFKSKEDIMDALGDRMFFHNNPFEILKKRDDLTGLEKIRQVMIMNQSNENQVELTMQAIPLLKNPQVLVKMLESNRKVLVPYWLELIEEGQKDGSIQTEYPREMAEFLVLLDFWMIPSVFPGDKEEIARRYQFIADTLEKIGLPLMNAETEALLALPYFDVNSHV